jgi:fermentation-respiration switch protein FrsA (DUF1100 family)
MAHLMARRIVILAAPLVVVVLVIGLAWMFQRSLIYFPDRTVPPLSALLPRGEEVSFTTEDGLELRGWLVPADGPERAAIVVFNGNAGNRADRADLARSFSAQGFTTLLFDYRGYGDNPGRPSQAGLIRDGMAAASFLSTRARVPLVLFGESLGGAVATEVAAVQAPAALILRSPFSSLVAVGRDHYWFLPVGWLLEDRWSTVDRIPDVAAPILVVASRNDEIVSYRRSEEVFTAAREPKQLVTFDDPRHNDYELTSGPRLIRSVTDFITSIVENLDDPAG